MTALDGEALGDLFADLGPLRTRRMFGGLGLYRGDRFFAIVAGGEVYLKADEDTAEVFRAAGSRPFTYDRAGRPTTISYWLLPEAALDDPDEAARWGRLALDAAARAASRPVKRKPRR